MSNATPSAPAPQRVSADFWKFWAGQTISNLGSSVTLFALPLLIFQLTGSALNLAVVTAVTFLPYLLFGLVIGAWVDRANRKRIMIITDLASGLFIASIPVLSAFGLLTLWWIYVVAFANSTLAIFSRSAEFAAIPSLVSRDQLVTANGRVQASYSAGMVLGPLLAGLLISIVAIENVLLINAASFAISSFSLTLIRISFNPQSAQPREATSLRRDILEGLRYVLSHPVLRNISIMMALVNLVATTQQAQLVLFASRQFDASETQIGMFYSAGSIGVIALSLAAGWLRKHWSFSRVALGSLMLSGLLSIALSQTTWYWGALVLWALVSGLAILFNINTGSLRQAIVPSHMLGRVISVAMVLAWSVNPLGAFLGGWAIERTGNVALVYGLIGLLIFLIPIGFAFTALGRAEQYLPDAAEQRRPAEGLGARG